MAELKAHTSIRLSEKHKAQIKETGKSPTEVIEEALDLYFSTDRTPVMRGEMKRLIRAEISRVQLEKKATA